MKRSLALLLAAGHLVAASAQVPIPNRPDGFVYRGGTGEVVLEAFFDLMCPDCKAAWPVVKQVADHYGPEKLKFLFHTFPLPYHRNAYWASQGAHIIAGANSSAVYPWLEAVFGAQDSFGNAATAGLTSPQIVANFAKLAESTTGVPAATFVTGIADSNTDWATRVSWKYSCSRYVSGTPTFLLNGVQVAADPAWSLADWQQLLDPFFATAVAATPSKVCPPNKPTCHFLPGKVECCLPGEACIPNVGCRCAGKDAPCATKSALALPTTCPADKPTCEYLPGKIECCLPGEACIPNVGCRCAGKDAPCATKPAVAPLAACPSDKPTCEYLPGKIECCLPGEACIPNVGCRCAGKDAPCAENSRVTVV